MWEMILFWVVLATFCLISGDYDGLIAVTISVLIVACGLWNVYRIAKR